jgi:hypothetical protein
MAHIPNFLVGGANHGSVTFTQNSNHTGGTWFAVTHRGHQPANNSTWSFTLTPTGDPNVMNISSTMSPPLGIDSNNYSTLSGTVGLTGGHITSGSGHLGGSSIADSTIVDIQWEASSVIPHKHHKAGA